MFNLRFVFCKEVDGSEFGDGHADGLAEEDEGDGTSSSVLAAATTGWDLSAFGDPGWAGTEEGGVPSSAGVQARPQKKGAAKKSGGSIVSCATCGCCTSSDDSVWYETEAQVVDGNVQDVPVGDACLMCGIATESWPLLDRPTVVLKYNSEPDFRSKFDLAKANVDTETCEPEFHEAHVVAEMRIGMRTETQCALVDADDYSAMNGVPPSAVPSVKLVSIVTEHGNPAKKLLGVLVALQDLPKDCNVSCS